MERKLNDALKDALECGGRIAREYSSRNDFMQVKMVQMADDIFLVLFKSDCGNFVDRFGLMHIDAAGLAFNSCSASVDIYNAKQYSSDHNCTVYVAQSGNTVIWSDSPSQITREGFRLIRCFENGL